ncbi:hypothetical protein ACFL1B_02645 [Nanoarchaeota archaeon]
MTAHISNLEIQLRDCLLPQMMNRGIDKETYGAGADVAIHTALHAGASIKDVKRVLAHYGFTLRETEPINGREMYNLERIREKPVNSPSNKDQSAEFFASISDIWDENPTAEIGASLMTKANHLMTHYSMAEGAPGSKRSNSIYLMAAMENLKQAETLNAGGDVQLFGNLMQQLENLYEHDSVIRKNSDCDHNRPATIH